MLPHIYPAKKDWQEGIVFHLLKQTNHNPLTLWELLTFNILKGIDNCRNHITRYLIIEYHLGGFHWKLQALQLTMRTPSYFLLPQFGVSHKQLKEGLMEDEARQAAAIFRIETEACLVEIWSKLCPTMSDEIFRMNTRAIRSLVMPFWKPESEHPSTLAFVPEHQPIHHIPPHISTGRRRLTHGPPGDDIIYHRNLDNADCLMAHNPKNSDNNPHPNIRNLRAAIARWHVGTMPVIEERGSHLGQG